jgi:Brp/Blh family beta-carotene 15,15'-monooxygenase
MKTAAWIETMARPGLMGHTLMFAGLSLAFIVGGALIGPGTTEMHLILLVALLPFFGIPHGALDYALAQKMMRHHWGPFWAPLFVLLYLLGMGIVLIVWRVHATASLAAFLVLTFYHFGKGDSLTRREMSGILRATELIGRGGVVLTFPAVFDRTEVMRLFSCLVPESGAGMLVQILAALAPLCAAALIACILASGIRFVRLGTDRDLARAIELLILAGMFALLPALLAFAIYFNALHSIRHMLGVALQKTTAPAISVWSHMFRTALPVTLATLMLGGGAFISLSGLAFDVPRLVQVVFIGIASMTYPHVVVVSLAERAGLSARHPTMANGPISSGFQS